MISNQDIELTNSAGQSGNLFHLFIIFERMKSTKTKKVTKRIVLFLLLAALAYGIYYVWFAFPIISGYSAKNACSCAFIQGRTKVNINKEELGSMPLSLGSIDINYKDSSVTGTVFGVAKRKAVYRTGFGCTLINDLSEDVVRAQKFSVPFVAKNYDSIWTKASVQDSASVNITKLNELVATAFQNEFNKKPVLTRALLVVRNNKIIAEKYAPGYDQNSMFLGWSMAKSVTSALIGILVRQGKLSTDQPAPVSEWQANDARQQIRLKDLLQQTSGLDFKEDYSSYSSATNMLFNKGDMGGYVAGLPLKVKPGTEFYYSSGNSNILSRIVRSTVGEKDYYAFPYDELFHKIGMYHSLLEPDASGTFVGSSYIYASARDYARFGMLYLNDGVWNSERILPEGWVRESVTPPAANRLKNYGYQFWLNGVNEKDPSQKEFPQMPPDFFYADGYGGQRIYIVPSKQLVAVRLGLNKFDEQRFLKLLMEL
jgi:CubicO group peptidase (beta-lactamase class C family)